MAEGDGLIDDFPLGERIRYLRKSRGLTQARMAKACGVSQGFLAQVEKSQTLPSLPVLFKITAALDIHVAILFASDNVFVLDIGKLRKSYKSRTSLTPALRRALREVSKYLDELDYARDSL